MRPDPVGVVGLGIMGGAYARRLLAAGFDVHGFDIRGDAIEALGRDGLQAEPTPAAVAARCPVVLLALSSPEAVEAAVAGPGGVVERISSDSLVCEMGTFSLELKAWVAEQLGGKGATVLDAPVSGTGAQAAMGDLVVYASGDGRGTERAGPVLSALAREVRHVGLYGDGTKLKFVANLLVTIHNLAAAEALLLAERSGLDLAMVHDAISAGAGTSRMFEVRGPLMIDGAYEPPTMTHGVYIKDVDLILAHAERTGSPAPLLRQSADYYREALAQGRGSEDTASLFEVLKATAAPQTSSRGTGTD